MAGAARKKDQIPFNADVLKWAREWRGRSIDEVASKLKQPAQKIEEWESKDSERSYSLAGANTTWYLHSQVA